MKKRKNAVLPFKRGERGCVTFPCPQCGQKLQTPIDFPGWCNCPNCQGEIFWRQIETIAVRVETSKCEICGEPVAKGGNVCGDCFAEVLCGDTICPKCGYVMAGNVCSVCMRDGAGADGSRCLLCGRPVAAGEWCICSKSPEIAF